MKSTNALGVQTYWGLCTMFQRAFVAPVHNFAPDSIGNVSNCCCLLQLFAGQQRAQHLFACNFLSIQALSTAPVSCVWSAADRTLVGATLTACSMCNDIKAGVRVGHKQVQKVLAAYTNMLRASGGVMQDSL